MEKLQVVALSGFKALNYLHDLRRQQMTSSKQKYSATHRIRRRYTKRLYRNRSHNQGPPIMPPDCKYYAISVTRPNKLHKHTRNKTYYFGIVHSELESKLFVGWNIYIRLFGEYLDKHSNLKEFATICRVISCSRMLVISGWLVGFSDPQRNIGFGSKLDEWVVDLEWTSNAWVFSLKCCVDCKATILEYPSRVLDK